MSTQQFLQCGTCRARWWCCECIANYVVKQGVQLTLSEGLRLKIAAISNRYSNEGGDATTAMAEIAAALGEPF